MIPEKFKVVCGGNTARIDISAPGIDVTVIHKRKVIEEIYHVLSLSENSTADIRVGHVPENVNLFEDSRSSHILFAADVEGVHYIRNALKEALEVEPLKITPRVEHTDVVWRDEEGKVYCRQGMRDSIECDDRLREKHYER